MRKIFVLLVATALSFSACIEGDTIVEEITQGATVRTNYITVKPNQWLKTDVSPGLPGYYIYATVNYPAISKYVLESGLIIAYYIEDYDNLLPYVRPYLGDIPFVETIRFDVELGKITFIIEASDFGSPPINYDMEFKVVTIAN